MNNERLDVLIAELQSIEGGLEAAMRLIAERSRAIDGAVSIDDGSRIDIDRERRVGFPEVIYCESKTSEQIIAIIRVLLDAHGLAFGTRCSEESARLILTEYPDGVYDPVARTIRIGSPRRGKNTSPVAVVSAGASDRPVAEEGAITLETFGGNVERVYDAGVAGVHRLMAERERIERCSAIIAVAGMEGALPSVLGGLFPQPIIAVPTSVGYGSAFGGLTPLFAILTSCASGVTVVNIDNGFGAAMAVLRMQIMAGR